jgi:hypothetical protein
MSKFKKIALIILAVPVVGFFCLWALCFSLDVATGSYSFRKSVKAIQLGMSRDDVVNKLGQPYEESKEPFCDDFIVFENPPLKTFRNKSSYYLIWFSPGIADEIYSVGFDADGKAVGTVYGSS